MENKKTLKEQIKGKVCQRCGGELEIVTFKEKYGSKTSSHKQPTCRPCSKIMWGCSKRIYKIATKFVKGYGFSSRYHEYDSTKKENLMKAKEEACGFLNYIDHNKLLD